MKQVRRNCRVVFALAILAAAPALVFSEPGSGRNHSFDLQGAGAIVCLDGAVFTGETTAPSSVGLLMTSEVWNDTGTTLIATGNTHTFTAVGEAFTFTVPYAPGTFSVGATIALAVTDVPGTFFGPEGDVATASVADCSIAVPTMPVWLLALLALILVAGGAVLLARRAEGRLAWRPADGLWLAVLLLAAAPATAGQEDPPPAFTKVFLPDTIGPGSVSMLIFTIDNSDAPRVPADMLAFSDTLPLDMTLASPAFVSNTCGGTLTAMDGATVVSLADGMVGGGASCEIVVNVTAPAVDLSDTTYMNVSGNLTSSLGNSGTASDDLMVDVDRPGFTKSFAPSTVAFGGRSTLTFTIDNSMNDSASLNLDFTDVLPPGMVVADPALASTDCGTATIPPTLTAVPGSSVIVLDANGTAGFPALAAVATCTVTVDVIGGAVGLLGNVSDELLVDLEVLSGKAAAVLEVTGVEDSLELSKEFTDDPVTPGGAVTLEFTVTNKSRDESATGVTFDDDLEATLTGLTPTLPPTPDPPCGAGSSLSFSLGVLTLTDGSLPPEGSCTFSVKLGVPGGSTPGTYPNTAGPVSGDVGGSPETGNVAGDLLFVVAFPVLTKEFTDDPVAAGDTVTLEFTVTNPSDSAMSDIEFLDELTDGTGDGEVGTGFLPFPVSVTLPPTPDPPCGGSSSLTLVSAGTDRQALSLTGGSLAAGSGTSCTFSVAVDIPLGFSGGTYLNTTEEISATLDDIGGTPTVVGPSATDTIVIASAPSLTKEFTDDPVLPSGGPVTLEFTLEYGVEEGTPDATAVAFTDDLTTLLPVVPGLVAASVDSNTCAGATVDISTPTLIDFSGGTLSAGESCTVVVTLTVPAASPVGFHANTTSDVTATVGGVMASNLGAEDDLLITPLVFTKEFFDDSVIPGDTTTLRFTIENNGTSSADDATITFFTDSLTAALSGLAATGPPSVDTCGGTLSGTTVLLYIGGSLTFGSTCTIEVEVLVPAMAADGDYLNVTSSLAVTIDGSAVTIDPATAVLSLSSTLLELTKEFTDDPVRPGDPVTLRFILENLSATETVTDIAFDDDLEAALSGLMATVASVNDCGGMAAGFPTSLFEYSGGTLMPGATCMIVLDVDVPIGPLPGSVFPNTTTSATGKVGTLDVFGEPASDDLEIDLLTFNKTFDGPTTATGTTVLTFTIENLDSVNAAVGLSFMDDLDAVIPGLVAGGLPASPCGAGSSLAGTLFLTLTGGSLPAGGTCSFDVIVTVPATATAGDFPNTTSGLFQSGVPAADPATASLTIEPPPTFDKSFAPDPILASSLSTLTFTIDNTASALAATGLDFTDSLPAAVVIAPLPSAATTCTGGTLTAVAGSGVVSYTGGAIAAGASCTVAVDVTAAIGGVFVNVSNDLTSSSGNSGPASDTLTVTAPPTFTKVFAPNPVGESFDTTLTFTIDNTASPIAVSGLAFSDMLPFDLLVSDVPGVVNTCGGAVVAPPSSTTIDLAGGAVGGGGSCTISVNVNAPSPGDFDNVTGDLTSSAGNSGTASDTLTVVECMAADGVNLTLGSGVVLTPEVYEVCNTIQVEEHFLVLGPNGFLTLRAGVAVIIFNGFEIAQDGQLLIEIDPSLVP